MLPMIQKHGLYLCEVRGNAPAACIGGGRPTWTHGKKFVGFISTSGRPLTDGTDDSTFLGCEWIEEFDGRSGYMVFSGQCLPRLIFSRGDVKAVFIGTPERSDHEYMLPKQVAVPTDAIHPVSCVDFEAAGQKYSVEVSYDRAFQGYANCPSDIEIVVSTSQYTSAVVPKSPISRQAWAALGYHIPTKETHAQDGVIPMEWDPRGLVLPFSSHEDAAAHGLAVVARQATTNNPPRLVAESLTILDPARAAAIHPIFARAAEGSAVSIRGKHDFFSPSYEVLLPLDCVDEIESLPLQITIKGGPLPRWVVNVSAVKVLPGKVVLGADHDKQRVALVGSDAELNSLFKTARSAAAQHSIPPTVEPIRAYVGGKVAPGMYYLIQELTSLPSGQSKRKLASERAKFLQEKYGKDLPKNWKKLTDEGIEALVSWQQHRAKGWLTRSELAASLGIPMDQSPDWFATFEIPTVNAADMERLYQPTTFETLRAHENFGVQCRGLFGNSADFILKCMFDEEARTSIFATLME